MAVEHLIAVHLSDLHDGGGASYICTGNATR